MPPLLPEPKPALLFVVQAAPGRAPEHCMAIREFLQSQLSGARHVVVLPPGVVLVSADAQSTPDLLKLPVIDPAALLPSTCSCGRGPVSFHPIGRKDATRMCVASPAACRPQQN